MAAESAVGSELRRSLRLKSRVVKELEGSSSPQPRVVKELKRSSSDQEATVEARRMKRAGSPLPEGTMKVYVNSGHSQVLPCQVTKDYDKPYELHVDSQLTIRDLVKMIQPLRWIPGNTLIVTQDASPPRLLRYDSTLSECGVKDGDLLLACMAGTFCVQVYSFWHKRRITIRVDSCFRTIGHLKKRIRRASCNPPKRLVVTTLYGTASLPNDTTLVSLGIVKPYGPGMYRTLSLKADFLD